MSDADVNNEEPHEKVPAEDTPTAADDSQVGDPAAALQQANDRLLRAQAELDNFRKRARRDAEESRRYANLPLIGDLLPVLDNLDRAVEVAEQSEQAAGLLEGVKMVSAQLLMVLEQHHCRRIEALGQPFDPNLHESIATDPSSDQPAGTITRVTRVGYQLHERVVRPPQVMIAAPAADRAAPEDQSSTATSETGQARASD